MNEPYENEYEYDPVESQDINYKPIINRLFTEGLDLFVSDYDGDLDSIPMEAMNDPDTTVEWLRNGSNEYATNQFNRLVAEQSDVLKQEHLYGKY